MPCSQSYPTSDNEKPHIDDEQFKELKDLLEEDFVGLLDTYMEDSMARIVELEIAQDRKGNKAGFEAAHALKGAASNFGAHKLMHLCHRMQEACRENTIHMQLPLLKAIKDEVVVVNYEIKRRLHD